MISTYSAIGLISDELLGGSSRPWKLHALREEDNLLVEVVAKLFNPKDLQQYQPIGKELFAYTLAKQFGLKVAKFGLVQFGTCFIHTLNEEQKERLRRINNDYRFAVEWIHNAPLLDVNHLQKSAYSHYEISLIYAFDHFIWNLDRRLDKPNLLASEDGLWLIDHEMCFPIQNYSYLNAFKNGIWSYKSKKHVFYGILCKLPRSKKLKIFDEFEEYLNRLDTKEIEHLCNFMNKYGVQHRTDKIILDHLRILQKESSKFKALLIQSIQ